MSKTEKSSSKKCKKCEESKKELYKLEMNIQRLTDELRRITTKCTKLEIVATDNGLLEEVGSVSDAEAICVEQLKKMKDLSEMVVFSKDDATVMDILHKNLKLARGEKLPKDSRAKVKNYSGAELLEIINDKKK